MKTPEEELEITEMDIIDEAHLRIDAILAYLEKKGLGSIEEFETFFEKYVEQLEEEYEE